MPSTDAVRQVIHRVRKKDLQVERERAIDLVVPPHLKICMVDFELAIINAFQLKFPTVTMCGCLFHLGQNIYRHIQKNGLVDAYRTNEETSLSLYALCKDIIHHNFLPSYVHLLTAGNTGVKQKKEQVQREERLRTVVGRHGTIPVDDYPQHAVERRGNRLRMKLFITFFLSWIKETLLQFAKE